MATISNEHTESPPVANTRISLKRRSRAVQSAISPTRDPLRQRDFPTMGEPAPRVLAFFDLHPGKTAVRTDYDEADMIKLPR